MPHLNYVHKSMGFLDLNNGILVFKSLPDVETKEETETTFMDAVKSGKIKPRDDVPDS